MAPTETAPIASLEEIVLVPANDVKDMQTAAPKVPGIKVEVLSITTPKDRQEAIALYAAAVVSRYGGRKDSEIKIVGSLVEAVAAKAIQVGSRVVRLTALGDEDQASRTLFDRFDNEVRRSRHRAALLRQR